MTSPRRVRPAPHRPAPEAAAVVSLASRRGSRVRDLLGTARPAQWQKNLLVYSALIFSAGEAWTPRDPSDWVPLLVTATAAFWLFNVVASGAYFVNDALDAERDRAHPRKRTRAVAAGRLGRRTALVIGGALLLAGVAGAFILRAPFGFAVLGYAALTLAYSVALKRVVVADVVTVATGFALRAIAGALAIDVPASPWLYVCTTLGALFVVVSKRRQEAALLASGGPAHREVLREYTPEFLDQLATVALAATIGGYAVYAATAPNLPRDHSMLLTVPFVLYGLLRFRLVAIREPERNADELVLRDPPLLASIALFLVTSLAVLARGGG